MVPGFPNFFMAGGPHLIAGNFPRATEIMVDYVTGVLRYARDHGYTYVAADPEAGTAWTEEVHEAASIALMAENSWFRGANIPGKTHEYLAYAGSLTKFRERMDAMEEQGYPGVTFGSPGADLTGGPPPQQLPGTVSRAGRDARRREEVGVQVGTLAPASRQTVRDADQECVLVDGPYRGALSFGVLQLTDWMCRRTGGSGCGNGYRRDDETKLLTLFVMTPEHGALFGVGLETGIDQVSEILRLARVCDAAGLDLVSLTDHPYFAERIDAYATLSFVLGATTNISAAAVMTNLLSRPAPILARTATRAAGSEVQ